MNSNEVFIVAARRTPIGSYLGALASLSAPELGAIAIRAALADARVAPELIDEVLIGNVLSAGIGQAPARQASIKGGIPDSVPCTTVSKVCGSGLMSVMLGAQAIRAGDADLVVAGGMESMSQVPYYLRKARTGYRMGNDELVDGMLFDGLFDSFNQCPMGVAGERCAREYGLTREAQDEFARQSYAKAIEAARAGHFAREIVPVTFSPKKGETVSVTEDEEPGRGKPEKFAQLRPAFEADGTITAANASSINDGAAAVVLASGRAVAAHGLTPLARVTHYAQAAQAPEWFTTAPAKAIAKSLTRAQLRPEDIDLFEINEAFSCVVQACTRLAALDPARVNVYGGAVALGHPIGASGARVLTTLVHALHTRQARRGLASLCIGGGEAVALVVERTTGSGGSTV
jgi:acetyl-CoA C-acetyltransferase